MQYGSHYTIVHMYLIFYSLFAELSSCFSPSLSILPSRRYFSLIIFDCFFESLLYLCNQSPNSLYPEVLNCDTCSFVPPCLLDLFYLFYNCFNDQDRDVGADDVQGGRPQGRWPPLH